jgi:hypothetical protein
MKKKILSILAVFIVLAIVVSMAQAQTGIPGSGWWSGEQVQNVGTSTANIVVTAYDKNSLATYTSSTTVTVGSAFTFLPNNFAGMPAGFSGSAVVSSDQPIKAIVNLTNQQSGSFGVAGGKAAGAYQGTENAATTLYFPLAKNNRFGNSTTFYVQNAGTSAATATAVFKMDTGAAGGVYTYTTPSIGANQMIAINPSDAGVPNSGGTGGRDNIGSLTVSSAQPLAGTVLEYVQTQTVATVLFATRGFASTDFNTKAYAPVVKNNRFGRFTGVQVQNVSASPIDVTINYVGTASSCAGVTSSDSATGIAPGASKTFVQQAPSNFTVNCTGSATISGTGNFVAIVNETNMTGSPLAGITYSAVSDGAKTTKISAPLFKDQRFNQSSGLQIQNVGTATATNVVATFSCKGGATFTAISNARTINQGAAYLFYHPSTMAGVFTAGNPFSSGNVNCSVTITSDQPVVAINNETSDNQTLPTSIDDANYEGFNLTP